MIKIVDMRVYGAIETACLDIMGKVLNRPMADLLGGSVRDRIPMIACLFWRYDRPGGGDDACAQDMADLYRKPIQFGECGCTSSTGGAMPPSGWSGQGRYDPDEQARYLEAVLRTYWDEPWWSGMYWWKWDEQNDRPQFKDDPRGDKGFTIDGKPAAQVMRRWYAREDRA